MNLTSGSGPSAVPTIKRGMRAAWGSVEVSDARACLTVAAGRRAEEAACKCGSDEAPYGVFVVLNS